MTPDSTSAAATAQAAAPDTGAPNRELRLIRLALVAGVLITAAWVLALVFFAWSLLPAVL